VLFICYLNWTDQGARAVKGVATRHENLKTEIAGLGGRLVGGYVTKVNMMSFSCSKCPTTTR
jgi:uncharacterized protein with GYD domain